MSIDENMPTLNHDLFYEILGRLDGATLATAACTCVTLCSISKEERLWENICSSMWPSTDRDDVKFLISSIGGFKKFYADCFPLIVNKQVPELRLNECFEYSEDWSEDEYYGDTDELENMSPSDFVSIVDVRYKDKTVFSKVFWGMSNEFNCWVNNYPFRMDLLTSDDISISLTDGIPEILTMEQERKDGKLWKDLRDEVRLSWIIVNKKVKQAANLSSWCSLGGQRHWPTENDFLLRFGSILPARDILPCHAVVECILIMRLKVVMVGTEGGNHGHRSNLQVTEMSMQMGDMEGGHVNGRNSLLLLKEALSCRRSRNYGEALDSCLLYSKMQRELKEEKIRIENRLDTLFILSSIVACFTFCYYFLL